MSELGSNSSIEKNGGFSFIRDREWERGNLGFLREKEVEWFGVVTVEAVAFIVIT